MDNLDAGDLYAACCSTDPARQAAAYEALWRYLYRVALQVLRKQADAEAQAEECAQRALWRIHQRLDECRDPAAFRAWSRRITGNLAIDILRRRRRLAFSLDAEGKHPPVPSAPAHYRTLEEVVARRVGREEIASLLEIAPVSDRSRRVIAGRYLEGLPDEVLARQESEQAEREVRPSHVQVTRAKNMSTLRDWELLREYAGKRSERYG